jgi:hypothetical protein
VTVKSDSTSTPLQKQKRILWILMEKGLQHRTLPKPQPNWSATFAEPTKLSDYGGCNCDTIEKYYCKMSWTWASTYIPHQTVPIVPSKNVKKKSESCLAIVCIPMCGLSVCLSVMRPMQPAVPEHHATALLLHVEAKNWHALQHLGQWCFGGQNCNATIWGQCVKMISSYKVNASSETKGHWQPQL